MGVGRLIAAGDPGRHALAQAGGPRRAASSGLGFLAGQGRVRWRYYDRLMAIRLGGDWEGWLRFFLTGVGEVAREAEQTARQIVQLREDMRRRAQAAGMSAIAFRLLDHLFERPMINVNGARDYLEVSYVAANGLIRELCDMGLLSETTGGSRNRMFRFGPYLDLFADVTEGDSEIAEPQPSRY